jgi:hypothetical protein
VRETRLSTHRLLLELVMLGNEIRATGREQKMLTKAVVAETCEQTCLDGLVPVRSYC